MILTIHKTGGSPGIDETLGTVDEALLDAESRHLLAHQLEDLTDLTSGHEPPDADCFRYEVEVQGPGRARNLVAVDDEGDPEQPAFKALGALMRTLGLPAPEAAPR